MKTVTTAALLLSMLLATAAFAQTPPAVSTPPTAPAPAPSAVAAPPVPSTLVWAAPTPGVCLMAREQVVTTSSAGAAAMQKLQQFNQLAKAELSREESAIRAEEKSLQAAAPTLAPVIAQKRQAAIARRVAAFQPKVQAKNEQLNHTRDSVLGRIDTAMQAVLPGVVATHHCAVIYERNATVGYNPVMDITTDVIARLNVQLPTMAIVLAPN